MHPSLKTYVDCFLSSPLPKMYPRGGGPHDQDPLLMRDFREIRKLEIQCKQEKEQIESASGKGGGLGGISNKLEEFIKEREEGEEATF